MQTNNYPEKQPQNAVATQQKPVETLKAMLDAPSVQNQFKNALGAHKDAFVASLIDLYTGDKALQTCKPSLLVAEALRAATMHLPLNRALGFAYIVVYNNKKKVTDTNGREQWVTEPTPTFIPGYKGYIQLAMRTGQYRTINADVVYEGELRKVDKLTGEIAFDGDRKSNKIVGYFCHFELLNGFSKTLYMSVEDMAAYAKRYSPSIRRDTTLEALVEKANNGTVSKQVGWEGNFGDMAIKTVIRRLLSKYGILSVEMVSAMDRDLEGSDFEQRDELIAGNANKRQLDIEDAPEYEEVDAETGEIRKPAAKPEPEAATTDAPAGNTEEGEDEAPY
jgi:recombination protein RecT